MTTPTVEFRNITMKFGDKVAVQDINLSIKSGAFVVLLGPSGGGKTTLLNILGGFLEPTAGQVLVNGHDVTHTPSSKRPTTTVFQDYALFPHMSIAGNVAFGLKMRGVPKSRQNQLVEQALDMVGLTHTASRRIHELSGGQRQRIALARALVVEPSVLLLDEPLGALDMKLRRQMQEELKSIQKRVGTTFIHVTHDQEEAMAIADEIVVMNDGFIEDIGAPERIYLEPASLFTANFMGENNIIEGRIIDRKEGDSGTQCLTVNTPLGQIPVNCVTPPEVSEIVLSIRPEHLHTGEPENGHVTLGVATVMDSGFFGTHHQCTVHLGETDTTLKVRLSQKDMVSAGDVVKLSADPGDFVALFR